MWGNPAAGSPENAKERMVPSKNNARGSLMGGSRNFSPEINRAATAKANKICEIAIENRIVTADPKDSQRAARKTFDADGFISCNFSMPNRSIE